MVRLMLHIWWKPTSSWYFTRSIGITKVSHYDWQIRLERFSALLININSFTNDWVIFKISKFIRNLLRSKQFHWRTILLCFSEEPNSHLIDKFQFLQCLFERYTLNFVGLLFFRELHFYKNQYSDDTQKYYEKKTTWRF